MYWGHYDLHGGPTSYVALGEKKEETTGRNQPETEVGNSSYRSSLSRSCQTQMVSSHSFLHFYDWTFSPLCRLAVCTIPASLSPFTSVSFHLFSILPFIGLSPCTQSLQWSHSLPFSFHTTNHLPKIKKTKANPPPINSPLPQKNNNMELSWHLPALYVCSEAV